MAGQVLRSRREVVDAIRSLPDTRHNAPRGTMLLPVVTLLHQAEEWFGGFPAWAAAILGREVPAELFLSVNAFGLLLFVVGTLAALLSPQLAWCAVSLATLLGVNGLLHAVATISSLP